jgi:hypothetical protein
MGIAQIPVASASTLKTLGLSVLSTNTSVTSLPTNKSITAVLIGGGASSQFISTVGAAAGGGTNGGASGQVREITFVLTSAVTASATIGAGGAGATSTSAGNSGGDTILSIPGLFSVTAPGGAAFGAQFSSGLGGGGGGGGAGGGGYSGSGAQGTDGLPGLTLGQKSISRQTNYAAGYPGVSQNIYQHQWSCPFISVSTGSNSMSVPTWTPHNFNVLPGMSITVPQDTTAYSVNSIGSTPSAIILSSNSGSTLSTPASFFVSQDAFAVLPTAIDLLTRANILIPGGGGGGGGGNYTVGSARNGGKGSGSGGDGGSGGYSDQANNNIRANNGVAGAQPGGGGGGTGGYGYQTLSGPSTTTTAAGGNGAVYFFWVA